LLEMAQARKFGKIICADAALASNFDCALPL
jgi:hypothetical protein